MKSLIVAVAVLGFAARLEAKPTAPATLALDARPVGDGFDVTLVATATRAVPSVELTIDGHRATFGATAVGQTRTLTVHLASAADVHARARLGGRVKLATLHRGRPVAKPQPYTLRVLPSGKAVAEVR